MVPVVLNGAYQMNAPVVLSKAPERDPDANDKVG